MKQREYKFPREKGKNAALDLIGLQFGRLTVVSRAPDKIDPKSGKHKSQWYCDCSCGTKNKIIRGTALTSGATNSCGCLHRETASVTAITKISHGKKYNEYKLLETFGIGYTSNGDEFYFDLDDYEKIKEYCWYINKGYVVAHDIYGTNNSLVRQHRLINNPSDSQVVDHINGCKNDNRKKNLRNIKQSNNAKNRCLPINNTSGHVGVHKLKNNKWQAYIGHNGETICLGTFNTFVEAVDVREEAEKKYFKEFRRNEKDSQKTCI